MIRPLLLAACAVGLAACGAQNRTSVEILGHAAPSDQNACNYTAGGLFQLGNGQYDITQGVAYTTGTTVINTPLAGYDVVLYVQNNLQDPSKVSQAQTKEANAWSAQSVRVRVNPKDYVGDYRPSPSLASITGEAVLPVAASPIVEPIGGQATLWVSLLSADLVTQLLGAAPGGYVVLGITLQGVTNAGQRIDSGEWMYPLFICSGCNAPPTTCPSGKTVQFACDGQQNELVCK
jgi:hypothetical protein